MAQIQLEVQKKELQKDSSRLRKTLENIAEISSLLLEIPEVQEGLKDNSRRPIALQIISLYLLEYNIKRIENITGVSQATVYKYIALCQQWRIKIVDKRLCPLCEIKMKENVCEKCSIQIFFHKGHQRKFQVVKKRRTPYYKKP